MKGPYRRRSLAALYKTGPRLERLEVDNRPPTPAKFLDLFTKVAHDRQGSTIGKATRHDVTTWSGSWRGAKVVLRVRVRNLVAGETFLISSNQRLRTSGHSGRHFLDVQVLEGPPGVEDDAELERLVAAADSLARLVILRRGRFRR